MTSSDSDFPRPPTTRLPRSFYRRDPAEVARRLLGQAILSRRPSAVGQGNGEDALICGGWIVETEAYLSSEDPASHSVIGPTKRNASMFSQAGTLYVYRIHMQHCLNVVTEPVDLGSAVLIRAIEPVWGIDLMSQRRGPHHPRRQLCRGPGRLCQALAIDKGYDGVDLTEHAEVWIAPWKHPRRLPIGVSPRIGISKAQQLPLRFFVDQNQYVSGRGADHSQRPRQSLG